MAARERAAPRAGVRRALLRPVPVVAGLLGLASACLNPHPDEQPTFNGSPVPGDQGTTDVSPPLTCADNPLLAGCAATSGEPQRPADSSGAGGSANAGAAGSSGSAGANGAPPDAGAAGDGGRDASERDAGPVDAMSGAADAG